MKILAIETSCDETAVALVDASGTVLKPNFNIIAQALHSQIKLHEQYGGVFPMMAKREHQKNLIPLFLRVLKNQKTKNKDADSKIKNKIQKILMKETFLFEQFEKHIINISKPKIDAIVVTEGPGLEPTLWVGINFARALGELWKIPVYGVNHMEGHFLTPLLNKEYISYPALALLVSGGHTELVYSKKPLNYQIIGKTLDDAVGEAFDKVARMLNLPYPGGPQISALAEKARSLKLEASSWSLPRPMIKSPDFNFSFSGIKTAVLYLIRDLGEITEEIKLKIAREFENAVVETLLYKTQKAIEKYELKTLIVGGGVSANKFLQKNIKKLAKTHKIKLLLPKKKQSTDNALMIAVAGYLGIKSKKLKAPKNAQGNLSL